MVCAILPAGLSAARDALEETPEQEAADDNTGNRQTSGHNIRQRRGDSVAEFIKRIREASEVKLTEHGIHGFRWFGFSSPSPTHREAS